MVNVWESLNAFGEAADFSAIWQIAGTVLVDEHGTLPALLGVRGVPFNLFVDADGTIIEAGASTPDKLRAAITRLLGREDWYELPPDTS